MKNLLLAMGLIAFCAYGYWLMARVDRYVTHKDRMRYGRMSAGAR